MSTKARRQATAAEERITGRRFCTSHQGAAEIAGGMMRDLRKGAPRWVCADCAEKSRYPLRKPDHEEAIANVITTEIVQPRMFDVFARTAWKPPVIHMRDGSNEYKQWPSKGGD